MRLVVISPPQPLAGERDLVRGMLKAGVTHFHYRRPSWQLQDMQACLLEYSTQERRSFVLHSHHDLVPELGLKGRHFTSRSRPPLPVRDPPFSSSASLHSIKEVQREAGGYDFVFLSPIFDSVSKQGYQAAFELEELRALLPAQCPVIALGGITVENCAVARDLGFDGVAVLGSIWQEPDPLSACKQFLSVCSML